MCMSIHFFLPCIHICATYTFPVPAEAIEHQNPKNLFQIVVSGLGTTLVPLWEQLVLLTLSRLPSPDSHSLAVRLGFDGILNFPIHSVTCCFQ